MKTKVSIYNLKLILVFLLSSVILKAQPAFNLVNIHGGINIMDIAYDENVGFFITDGNDIYYSQDAVIWEFLSDNSVIINQQIYNIAAKNSFVFLAAGGSLYEYEAINNIWEQRYVDEFSDIYYIEGIHYVGERLLVVLNTNTSRYVYYSDDYGQNWTQGANLDINSTIIVKSYSDKYMLFACENNVYFTSDGISITTIDLSGHIVNGYEAINNMDASETSDNLYYKSFIHYDFATESWTYVGPDFPVSSSPASQRIIASDSIIYFTHKMEDYYVTGTWNFQLIMSKEHGDTYEWEPVNNHGISTIPVFKYLHQYSPTGYISNTISEALYISEDGLQFNSSGSGLYGTRYNVVADENILFLNNSTSFSMCYYEALNYTNVYFLKDVINFNGTLFYSIICNPTSNNTNSLNNDYSCLSDFKFCGKNDDYVFFYWEDSIKGYDDPYEFCDPYVSYSEVNLTNSIQSLNIDKLYFITGKDGYTYLFASTDANNTKAYYSVNNGIDWTETSFDNNVQYVVNQDDNYYIKKVAMMFDTDNLPVVLVYNENTEENCLYKLNSNMTIWEELETTGLPADQFGLAINTHIIGMENIIITTHGVFYSSDILNWESYGTGFREGINVISAGINENHLYIGTNGSGIWKIEVFPTIINTLENETLNIYPNPTQQNFIVETDLWQKPNTQVHITDIKGKLIKTKIINSQRTEINTFGWQRGVYVCNLFVEGKLVRVEKLVLE